MAGLTFQVRKASAVPFAASPMLALELAIRAAGPAEIRAVALRCQVWIEAQRRRYTAEEQGALREIFGEPGLWERSLRPLLWTHASVMVPAFAGETVVDLPLACSFDFTVASARYLCALAGGEAPILLAFSGTIFHAADTGAIAISPVPWTEEVRAAIPASVFREMHEHYYPGGAPLILRKDVFERLYRHRMRKGFASWDQAIESLLPPDDGGQR